jgi:hypothetical protein
MPSTAAAAKPSSEILGVWIRRFIISKMLFSNSLRKNAGTLPLHLRETDAHAV